MKYLTFLLLFLATACVSSGRSLEYGQGPEHEQDVFYLTLDSNSYEAKGLTVYCDGLRLKQISNIRLMRPERYEIKHRWCTDIYFVVNLQGGYDQRLEYSLPGVNPDVNICIDIQPMVHTTMPYLGTRCE